MLKIPPIIITNLFLRHVDVLMLWHGKPTDHNNGKPINPGKSSLLWRHFWHTIVIHTHQGVSYHLQLLVPREAWFIFSSHFFSTPPIPPPPPPHTHIDAHTHTLTHTQELSLPFQCQPLPLSYLCPHTSSLVPTASKTAHLTLCQAAPIPPSHRSQPSCSTITLLSPLVSTPHTPPPPPPTQILPPPPPKYYHHHHPNKQYYHPIPPPPASGEVTTSYKRGSDSWGEPAINPEFQSAGKSSTSRKV